MLRFICSMTARKPTAAGAQGMADLDLVAVRGGGRDIPATGRAIRAGTRRHNASSRRHRRGGIWPRRAEGSEGDRYRAGHFLSCSPASTTRRRQSQKFVSRDLTRWHRECTIRADTPRHACPLTAQHIERKSKPSAPRQTTPASPPGARHGRIRIAGQREVGPERAA